VNPNLLCESNSLRKKNPGRKVVNIIDEKYLNQFSTDSWDHCNIEKLVGEIRITDKIEIIVNPIKTISSIFEFTSFTEKKSLFEKLKFNEKKNIAKEKGIPIHKINISSNKFENT